MSFIEDEKAADRACPQGMEEIYMRCQRCGSWDVQVDCRAWFHPNRDMALVEGAEIGDEQATWCERCAEEGDVRRLIDYDPGDVEGANQAYARAQDLNPPWRWEDGNPDRPMTQDAMGGP